MRSFLLVLLALCLAAASCSNPVNAESPVEAGEGDSPVGDAEEAGGKDSPDAEEGSPSSDLEERRRIVYVPDLMEGRQIVYKRRARTTTVGNSPFTHSLTKPDVPGDTGAITYTSSNPKVAKVDESSGRVTPLSEGKTTITAIKAETSTHKGTRASYVLTVEKKSLLRRTWDWIKPW